MTEADANQCDSRKRTRLTLEVDEDDAQRIIQAFESGKLAELGVQAITVVDQQAQGQARWTTDIGRHKGNPTRDSENQKG